MAEQRYKADITAGSLKVAESRIVAGLLLEGVDDSAWSDAIEKENVLHLRSTASAKRLARLIRVRLETMEAGLWKLVRDGSGIVATHAVLACAVKHSPLLGDFLDIVVREQFRVFAPRLTKSLWEDYLSGCKGRDPDMTEWNEATSNRLRSSVYQTLAQAGFLEDTQTLKLQPVYIASPVIQYLQEHREEYVLRCLQVAP